MLDIKLEAERFGQAVRAARKAKDISVETIARELDVNPNSIHNLIRGDRNPSLEMVLALEALLGTPVGYLFQYLSDRYGDTESIGDTFSLSVQLSPERKLIAMGLLRDLEKAELYDRQKTPVEEKEAGMFGKKDKDTEARMQKVADEDLARRQANKPQPQPQEKPNKGREEKDNSKKREMAGRR
jgi:transcriptional regulator with XRE-family HTH domain